MKKQSGFTLSELLLCLLYVIGGTGWLLNIAKLIASDFDPITIVLVLRFIGLVLIPLGAIMGFM